MPPITTEAEAKRELNAMTRKYPDATRKGWEARKNYAKQLGIETKDFKLGLGPQLDRLTGLIRGVKEINAVVPVDARSVKAFPGEIAKTRKIINAYAKILGPKPKTSDLTFYGWYAIHEGLKSVTSWLDQVQRTAEVLARKQPAK
jgi:hypothetical protein